MGSGRRKLRWRRQAWVAVVFALLLPVTMAIPHAPGATGEPWHLDESFGGGTGEVVTKFGSGFDEVFDVAVQTDGKIIAVGANSSNFAIARYRPTGALDGDFSGPISLDFHNSDDLARGVAVEPDGRIVVVGNADDPANGDIPEASVAVLDSFGNVQSKTSFDILGFSSANAVVVYPPGTGNAGKILIAGYAGAGGSSSQFLVARLMPDGKSFDTTFGNGGNGFATFPLLTNGPNLANAVTLDSNSKIVVVGTTDQNPFSDIGKMGVLRLNADGTPDTTFGGLGTGWTADTGITGAGWAAGIRADGSVYAVGQQVASEGSDMYARRYSSAGILKAELFADFFGHDDAARDIVFLPGTVTLVGWAAETGDGSTTNDLIHFALARFTNVPEAVDNTFGDNTNKITAAFAFGYDAALAAAATPDEDIVAAGGSNQVFPPSQDIDFALAQFTGPGSSSSSFTTQMYNLKTFTLKPAPQKFRVYWVANFPPSPTLKYDLRSREARFDQTSFGDWRILVTKSTERSALVKVLAGRTVCFEARSHAGGQTTPWSEEECTEIPVDDRTLDVQPAGTWGSYTRSDCYRDTYRGTGHGTGAQLHLEAAFKQLAVIVAKGNGFGRLKVLVDGVAVETIDLQATAVHCGVLIPIKTYKSVKRRDVDIVHVKSAKPVFVDGLGTSLV